MTGRERGRLDTYIALVRGINVGGKNLLPMKDLVSIVGNLGAEQVRTYIQSGNVVFRHRSTDAAGLAHAVGDAIRESQGFEPRVLVLHVHDLERAIAANPFPEAEDEPKSLHLFFLASVPQAPDLETLEEIAGPDERFRLVGRVFYLYAPHGIGRSKLAARAEKALGVAATGRNWRTMGKIAEMIDTGA